MNDYIARFRVNDFEKQELKEHIREVQKLAAAMGKRVDLRRPVSSKELYSDKKNYFGKYAFSCRLTS